MLDERIQAALDSHSPVDVAYMGGSQPGVLRRITPIELKGQLLRARCHTTGVAKAFRVDRLVVAGDDLPEYVAEPSPQFHTIQDVRAFYEDTIVGRGLAVQLEATNGEEHLTVHRKFKNGKVMKGSIARLSLSPFVEQSYVDMEGDALVERVDRHRTDKPWLIWAKGVTTSRFKYLDKAAKKFIECVMKAKV